jgi:hypothetical protein
MARVRSSALVALVALLIPAAASAKPAPQPLRDEVPLGGHFKDRVFTSSSRTAAAAISGTWSNYPTTDGYNVSAAISDRYAAQPTGTVAQSYVSFLDSLAHGPELGTLKVYIAPPDEVASECGGADGTLACYDSRTQIMYVPGEQTDSGSSGVTTSYVIAHEYGHHIAASRSNAPFSAFAFGPKYWASYELVCTRALNGQLDPGNEDVNYLSNPGEGWAETYAHLKYPEVDWRFNPIMQPDAGAFDAARRDVLNPWPGQTTKVFAGSFGKGGSRTKRFSFDLTLDGRLQVRLTGPRSANFNLAIRSNGRRQGRTSTSGSRDRLSYAAACRQEPTEHVTVAVKRVKGTGPFTLRVNYAG